ncbi:MAG: hypothetical protein DKT66_05900 [Candidatus Melainabacteria bacterium]|nr:MAG: hypothetical protein DKT66_05900 [Candidatus Melainabacteria bacterium]
MGKKKGSSKSEASPKETGDDDSLRVDSAVSKTEPTTSSCMEAATTPCPAIADVVDNAEISEMCSELVAAPCTDEDDAYNELANSTSTEVSAQPAVELTTSSSAEVQQTEGGVTDLVAQQLRQMLEEGGGGTATCATAGSFTGTHTMNLNVKAGAVDMNLSTVTEANQELIELKTQIELQKRLLADAQDRLDVANQRIGFLESELARKDREKQEQSGWLKSLLGI